MRSARRLSVLLAALMSAQALTGLVFQHQYRDEAWIRAAWYGNDWVTLLAAVPLLVLGLLGAARGSMRGLLIWLGVLGYAAYNYAFYLFGAALNAFFLLYVLAFVIAVISLILVLSSVDVSGLARSFRPETPVRIIGGLLALIGVALGSVWVAMWAAHVFAGRPTPVGPEAFRLVAALDLSLMVPALTAGGVLLWRHAPWGYVLAAVASIQGALYLLVLSVNAIVGIRRGLVKAPGELPIWGALMVLTTALAVMLVASVRPSACRSTPSRMGRDTMPVPPPPSSWTGGAR